MDQVTIAGAVVALLGVALGPGGVFYFLVKRGLNGAVQAIERTDKTVGKIAAVQTLDHDRLVQAVTTLDALKEEQKHYNTLVDRNTKAIIAVQSRCEVLHKEQMRGRTTQQEGP